tara:strand:+ start:11358 stop:11915 length:558 start_codon:yes stop_codon:yes gene_type:complete
MNKNQLLQERIQTLIDEGEKITFSNNSYSSHGERYGKVSIELNSWKARVEQLILENYGDYSGPYKLLESGDFQKINGNYSNEFDRQLSIFKGAISACKGLPKKIINKPSNLNDHPVIGLIQNRYFWGVLSILTGGAFVLGMHFGNSRFDSEKNALYEENRNFRIQVESLNKELNNQKDSIPSSSE